MLLPCLLFSQEKSYRILTNDGEVIYAKKLRVTDKRIDILDINGKPISFKTKDIASFREEIPNWEYFTFGKEEFTDFVVVNVDSTTQQKLFDTTINWIKETYKNPDEVIKTTIDNSKIRLEGFQNGIVILTVLGMPSVYNGTYTIEISFKEGRYKFDPINVNYYVPSSQYVAGGYSDFTVGNVKGFYNEKGKFKKVFKYMPNILETLFNDLNINLYNYLLQNNTESVTNDDW